MSEAENLLNTLGDISIATADPSTEEHIIIDSNRNIYVPESLRRIAVQHDHNIETVTFDCPRYWDGNDLSEMKFYVNYRRADGKTGMYHVENVRIDEEYRVVKIIDSPASNVYTVEISDETYTPSLDDIDYGTTVDGYPIYMSRETGSNVHYVKIGSPDIIHFDWIISRNVTEAKGNLSFLVCINTTDDDGNETLHWNSELNQQMIVSEGLEVDSYIEELYPDIITRLLIRMDNVEKDNAATRDYIDNSINLEMNSIIENKIENGELTGVDLSGYVKVSDVADSIIEQGTVTVDIEAMNNGYTESTFTWTYEKYNNGTYKCWGQIPFEDSDISNSGITIAQTIDMPVTFVGTPLIWPSINNAFGVYDMSVVSVLYRSAYNNIHSVTLTYAPVAGGDSISGLLNLYVIGRWK